MVEMGRHANTLGVITRSDGSQQATYDGHPRYTYSYSGDSVRLEATGDALKSYGGQWHAMAVSGVTSQVSSAATSSSGGSGY
jgi:predicted lipoprotein with Yx(FWY)xxD motif